MRFFIFSIALLFVIITPLYGAQPDTSCSGVVKRINGKFDSIGKANATTKLRIAKEILFYLSEGNLRDCKDTLLDTEWFSPKSLDYFTEIRKISKTSPGFNGFEYLVAIRPIYINSAEQDEILGRTLAQVAMDDPLKFIHYISKYKDFAEREKIYRLPSWNEINIAAFEKKIAKSVWYSELKPILETSK